MSVSYFLNPPFCVGQLLRSCTRLNLIKGRFPVPWGVRSAKKWLFHTPSACGGVVDFLLVKKEEVSRKKLRTSFPMVFSLFHIMIFQPNQAQLNEQIIMMLLRWTGKTRSSGCLIAIKVGVLRLLTPLGVKSLFSLPAATGIVT